jgi:hydrogenase maturation protease
VPEAVQREAVQALRVVCLGNALAGDDAAGLEVAAALPAGAAEIGGPDLLGLLDCVQPLLIVDAVSSGAPAGTVHLLPLPAAALEVRARGSISTHGLSLPDGLELARRVGLRLPPMLLLGIEIGDVTLGAPATAPVQSAIASVLAGFERLRAELACPASSLWHAPRRFPPGSSFPGV